MKSLVAMIALGVVLALAGVVGGRSTAAADTPTAGGHGILVVGKPAGSYKPRIFLWNPGSPAKPLGSAAGSVADPVWSPDGRSIAWDQGSGIFVMRADGTGARNLAYDGPGEGAPSWSPDGREIVYEPGPGYDDKLVIVNVRSRRERTLHTHHFCSSAPADVAWGKAGIVYTSEFGATLLGPTSGRSRLLTHGCFGWPSPVAWSPNGVLAVVKAKRILLLARNGRELGHLPIPPTASPRVVCAIAWSPDGKQILAWAIKVSGGSIYGAPGLWVATVGTKQWRRFPTPLRTAATLSCAASWR